MWSDYPSIPPRLVSRIGRVQPLCSLRSQEESRHREWNYSWEWRFSKKSCGWLMLRRPHIPEIVLDGPQASGERCGHPLLVPGLLVELLLLDGGRGEAALQKSIDLVVRLLNSVSSSVAAARDALFSSCSHSVRSYPLLLSRYLFHFIYKHTQWWKLSGRKPKILLIQSMVALGARIPLWWSKGFHTSSTVLDSNNAASRETLQITNKQKDSELNCHKLFHRCHYFSIKS